MFRDTSLNAAQKQKEAILRDQQNKIDKHLKRKQMYLDNKQKISLREFYRKEYSVKVLQKIMDSLSVQEFEEYLKRRHRELKENEARKVLHRYLLGYVCKFRFKKMMKLRNEKAIIIQKYFRMHYRHRSGSIKKKRINAIKVIEAHLKSYQVFIKYRDILYKMRLKNNFLYFTYLRQGLLSKSQRIIRKYWLRVSIFF